MVSKSILYAMKDDPKLVATHFLLRRSILSKASLLNCRYICARLEQNETHTSLKL